MADTRYTIKVCYRDECIFPLNMKLREVLRTEVHKNNLVDKAQVVGMGCTGHCAPVVIIEEAGGPRYLYSNLTLDRVERFIQEHIMQDQPIKEWSIKLV